MNTDKRGCPKSNFTWDTPFLRKKNKKIAQFGIMKSPQPISQKERNDFLMYKNYTINQLVLPMDIEILIPENHLCRLVDMAVEKMNPNLLAFLHPV